MRLASPIATLWARDCNEAAHGLLASRNLRPHSTPDFCVVAGDVDGVRFGCALGIEAHCTDETPSAGPAFATGLLGNKPLADADNIIECRSYLRPGKFGTVFIGHSFPKRSFKLRCHTGKGDGGGFG